MVQTTTRDRRGGAFSRVFLPTFIILLAIFTGAIFLIDKFGFFGLIGGDIMKDVKPWVGAKTAFSQKYPDSKRINVLLLGHNQELTDTIMLGSFDTELKRVDIVSVPRDTYYPRPDHPGATLQKINAVYKTENVRMAAKAVSNVLGGVPIHYYAIIDDDGVRKIVDAMGGVTIDVPMDMHYTDRKQGLYINLKKGKQKLNGKKAVQFIRYRKGYVEGDIGRVKAQQTFMKEAFKQSIGIGFPKVAETVAKEVKNNIGMQMAVRIASEAAGMKSKSIKSWMMPGEARRMDGLWYFFADEAETSKMMNRIYSMKPKEKK
ncbi:MAG: LCP family protein [Clostridiales Family XIII bacterium]|jgi:LCP family protein required for cell wall assembly|nr:LCP family protein [Clostridiales Family XIII bacterium]